MYKQDSVQDMALRLLHCFAPSCACTLLFPPAPKFSLFSHTLPLTLPLALPLALFAALIAALIPSASCPLFSSFLAARLRGSDIDTRYRMRSLTVERVRLFCLFLAARFRGVSELRPSGNRSRQT